MHLMLFDYSGTLDTLPDPVAYIQALKRHRPAAWLVMHTGTDLASINATHPGLIEALDDVWLKPYLLSAKITELQVMEITVVDDDVRQQNLAYRGAAPTIPPMFLHIHGVEALQGLLQ